MPICVSLGSSDIVEQKEGKNKHLLFKFQDINFHHTIFIQFFEYRAQIRAVCEAYDP